METPTSTSSTLPQSTEVEGLAHQLENLRPNIDTPVKQLSANDPPWQGHIYVIKYQDSSRVLTYGEPEGVILAEYEGKPTQRWICHIKEGWLGFTNDPVETTAYLGHYQTMKLHCRATHHLHQEMFCVRKRLGEGFQILARFDQSLHPVGIDEAGDPAVVRYSEEWWGFHLLA
ncbi:hypothetical protein TWF481_007990 [Arthrobotrys musiformis]|uniref:Uncharacterized protein n=1 Tax=Arthrobotrys musiformis TaxID=47236 RepID=A0AAV9W7L1_9PEZI